ncbi:endonuclease [Salibacteraceae bacterium]|nr:endonuclease [Salibacteraceae bacterium]
MKKIWLYFALCISTFSSQSQDWFSFSPDSLNFGSFSPGIADTKMVVVTFNGPDTPFVIKPYAPAVYGTYHPYTVLNTLEFDGDGSSDTMWVAFASNQNLNYDTYIILAHKFVGAHSYRVKGRILFPKTYYGSTFDLREEALKTELTSILNNATTLGYSGARDRMFLTIDNWKVNGRGSSVNKLEGIYTALVASNYANRSAAQNMGFNTEHSYPQSMFNSDEPMRSDLHHLYPADASANSSRGNLPFGIATGGTAVGTAGSKRTSTTFEPRDFVKGQIARSMMYFQLRYGNKGDFFRPIEATMRDWHQQFPVSTIEVNRNDDIDIYQGNRSPFVDYPQFIERINSLEGYSRSDSAFRVSVWPMDSLVIPESGYSGFNSFFIQLMNEGDTSIVLESIDTIVPIAHQGGFEINMWSNMPTPPFVIQAKESFKLGVSIVAGVISQEVKFAFVFNFSGGISKTLGVNVTNAPRWESVGEEVGNILSIWPNPVTSSLNLSLERSRAYDIKNPEGQLVLQGSTVSSIDVSSLKSGIYFLSLPELKQQIRFVKM